MPKATGTRRTYAKGESGARGRQAFTRQERLYGSDWERFRDAEFQRQIAESGSPFCRLCEAAIAGTPSGKALLDHLIPPGRIAGHKTPEYRRLHRDWRNLVPVCKPCNDRKGNRLPREIDDEAMRAKVESLIESRNVVARIPG